MSLPIPNTVFAQMCENLLKKFEEDFNKAVSSAAAQGTDPDALRSIRLAYLYAMMQMVGKVFGQVNVPYPQLLELCACAGAKYKTLTPTEDELHDFMHQIAKLPLEHVSFGALSGPTAMAALEHFKKMDSSGLDPKGPRGESPFDAMIREHSLGTKPPNDKPN